MIKFIFLMSIILFSFTYLYGQSNDSADVYKQVKKFYFENSSPDNSPQFKNEEFSDFILWVNNEFKKNTIVKDCNVEAQLIIRFVVNSSGLVKDVKINYAPDNKTNVSAISISCINAITQIVESSGKFWVGGSHKGQPVSVEYFFPVTLSY